VALFFRPLAVLPFMTAYHIWMAFTLCLYLAGLYVLVQTFVPDDRLYKAAWFVGALLFWPFLGHTLLNGQLSAVAFFAMSSALSAQYREKHYLSGLALSLCLYKPPLLIWIVPLLLMARAGKTLIGFLSAASVLFVVTTASLGPQIWARYADTTANLGDWERHAHQEYHLEIFGQLALAMGRLPGLEGWICFLAAGLGIVLIWRYVLGRTVRKRVVSAWAITLSASLVVNVYTPVYDSILLIPALIASAKVKAFERVHPQLLVPGCLLLLVVSYCTTWIGNHCRIQPLSILIAMTCAVQLLGLSKSFDAPLRALTSRNVDHSHATSDGAL
jgi:hypothetical protein